MTIEKIIKCDSCCREFKESSMPDYRLQLSNAPNPTGSVVYSVYCEPLVKNSMDFCGFGCLKKWIGDNKL